MCETCIDEQRSSRQDRLVGQVPGLRRGGGVSRGDALFGRGQLVPPEPRVSVRNEQ
jgi:hypothetical protein